MSTFEETHVHLRSDDGGAPPAGWGGERQCCLLVVLHTPLGKNVGAKLVVEAPVFRLGAEGDDWIVEGAALSGTHAEVAWTTGGESSSAPGWRLKGSGRLFINGEAATDQALRSGDELRVADSLFRFLSGKGAEEKYRETIYDSTIIDFASGAHNQRYLAELLFRERERAIRYKRQFSVAVIGLEPHPGNEKVDYDLLRPVVNGLRERSAHDWIIARTRGLELAVLAPEAALQLESHLAAMIPGCLPKEIRAHLGTVEHDADLELEQLVPTARLNTAPLPGSPCPAA